MKNKSTNLINETKTIESNQLKLLQEQNIDLAKELQDIKLKLDVLQEHKIFDETTSKKTDDNIQKIEISLVSLKVVE